MTIIEIIMSKLFEPHRVAFLLLDGFISADFAGPSEILNRVVLKDGKKAYETRLCSQNLKVSCEEYTLQTPYNLDAIAWCESLILPGTHNLVNPLSNEAKSLIQQAFHQGKRVISICSGAFVLAETGLLNGKEATTHWVLTKYFKSRYPKVSLNPNVLFVEQDGIYTSAGAAAGLDLMLHLIRQDHGAEVAASAARLAVIPLERPGGQAQFIEEDLPGKSEYDLHSLLTWIEANLNKDLSLSKLSKKASVSERTLHRRFMKLLSMSPATYVTHVRIKKARALLETSLMSIEQISSQTGFGTSANFRQRFRQKLGVSPTEYRASFQVK